MALVSGIGGLGPVMQLAWLPQDFDAAINHWTQVMGVGPFYLMENIALENMTYLGAPTDAVFSLALAYWGDMQIEMIRPENDAPSIYNGKYAVRDRLHHVCLLTDDIAHARQICVDQGGEIVIEAKVGDDGGVIYMDPHSPGGHLVEILRPSTGSEGLFDMIKQAGIGWDGMDPLRKLG
jgi:hypothetical protein